MKARLILSLFLVASLRSAAAEDKLLLVNHPPIASEQNKAFIREMAAFVERLHLQKDQSPQRGTIHEYVVMKRLKGDQLPETNPGQWGQWVQPVGGDTVHAAMYYSIAMLHASRALDEPRYRQFVTDYPLPWMHKMITQSDTLFPVQKGTKRSGLTLTIDQPLKGYVPFWWDEGQVVCILPEKFKQFFEVVGEVTEEENKPGSVYRFKGYTKAVSQHMAQDIAMMLTETWWNTHDPRCVEAARDLAHFYEVATPWRMPVVIGLDAVTRRDAAAIKKIAVENPVPESSTFAFHIMYSSCLGKSPEAPLITPGFHDSEQFSFYVDLMRNGTQPTEAGALALIATAYLDPLLIQSWADAAPLPNGVNRFERVPKQTTWSNGAPVQYRSESPQPFGVRSGPQQLVHAALALQAMKQFPTAWTDVRQKKHPTDWLVPVHPEGSAKQDVWSAQWSTAAGKLELNSKRHSLDLRGESTKPELTLQISGRPDAGNPFAKIFLKQDGSISAVDHDNKPVKFTGKVTATAGGFTFALNIPYTANKGQGPWVNGIDHGRYLVDFGGEQRVAYLLTAQEEVVAWLENFVGTSLANFQAIFKAKGFLPFVIRDGNRGYEWGNAGPGDEISHLYGYAFLISAASQYQLYLDGKTYWPVETNTKP